MKRPALTAGMLTGLTALAALVAWLTSSCSPSDFTSVTVLEGVRILASRASEPRAKPGDSVKVDMLAYDGRLNQTPPMKLFWLPIMCLNPAQDAYFACFAQLAGGGAADAGAILPLAPPDGGPPNVAALANLLKPGVPLDDALIAGNTVTFTVPQDAIIDRTGVSPSYGLVILFNIACAGHPEIVPADPNSGNPQDIPIGCFDDQNNRLGPESYVIGFTRVYAYADSPETNPVITAVDLGNGNQLLIDGGVTTDSFKVPFCTTKDQGDCPKNPIGPVVPPSNPTSKQVYADFYATTGTFTSEARLLFDPTVSLKIPNDTNNNFKAPNTVVGLPKSNSVFIVVHDNQGGADWVTVPLDILPADAGTDGAADQ
jgi:hypothetical protein